MHLDVPGSIRPPGLSRMFRQAVMNSFWLGLKQLTASAPGSLASCMIVYLVFVHRSGRLLALPLP